MQTTRNLKITVEDYVRKNISGYERKNLVLPFAVETGKIAKGFVITEVGQIEDKILLLSQGIVKVSMYKGDEERILEFVFPGRFFCAYTSFLLHQPSDVELKSLTSCQVSIIQKEAFVKAMSSSLLASHLGLHIAQQLFLSRALREKELLSLSAAERYTNLMQKSPHVIATLPGKNVASYLGIKPESLSRIRRTAFQKARQ